MNSPDFGEQKDFREYLFLFNRFAESSRAEDQNNDGHGARSSSCFWPVGAPRASAAPCRRLLNSSLPHWRKRSDARMKRNDMKRTNKNTSGVIIYIKSYLEFLKIIFFIFVDMLQSSETVWKLQSLPLAGCCPCSLVKMTFIEFLGVVQSLWGFVKHFEMPQRVKDDRDALKQ